MGGEWWRWRCWCALALANIFSRFLSFGRRALAHTKLIDFYIFHEFASMGIDGPGPACCLPLKPAVPPEPGKYYYYASTVQHRVHKESSSTHTHTLQKNWFASREYSISDGIGAMVAVLSFFCFCVRCCFISFAAASINYCAREALELCS